MERGSSDPPRFSKVVGDVLEAEIEPLFKLVLIDLLTRLRRHREVPSVNDRARMLGVDRKVILRAERWLEVEGYILAGRGHGRRNVYLPTFPPIPIGHPDRPDFEERFGRISPSKQSLTGTTSETDRTENELKAVPHRDQSLTGTTLNPAPPSPVPPLTTPLVPPTPEREISSAATEKKSRKQPDTPHHNLIRAYEAACGYPLRDGAKEAAAAKWLLEHDYSQKQVLDCYRFLAADPWWEGKNISLQTVASRIGAWLKSQNGGRQKQPRYYEQPTPEEAAERDRVARAALKARGI